MRAALRLSVWSAPALLVLAGGWASYRCLADRVVDPLRTTMTAGRRAEELQAQLAAMQQRNAARARAVAALLAGEADLDQTAAAFRDSDTGLDWLTATGQEQSYEQVLNWVSLAPQDRGIASRLGVEFTRRFGHPPTSPWLCGSSPGGGSAPDSLAPSAIRVGP